MKGMQPAKVYIAAADTALGKKLERILESNAFQVALFERGYDVAAMMDNWPDLFLIDITLPDINGLEVCSWLKSHEESSHIPVILMTDESYLKVFAATAHADDCVETRNAASQIVHKVNDCLTAVRTEHKM